MFYPVSAGYILLEGLIFHLFLLRYKWMFNALWPSLC